MQATDSNSVIFDVHPGPHPAGEARARAFTQIEAEMAGERMSASGSVIRITWASAFLLLGVGASQLLFGPLNLPASPFGDGVFSGARWAGLSFAESGLVASLLASSLAYVGLIGALSLRLPVPTRRGILRAAVGKAAWFHIIVLPLLAMGREISPPAVAAIFAVLVLVDHLLLPIGRSGEPRARAEALHAASPRAKVSL